ncbi:MAG TPA: HAD family hydrolase [candidate division Zixibacteria bacterium]
MIDTVTFDLWNTLISNQPMDHDRYRQIRVEGTGQILKEYGVVISLDHWAKAYDDGFERYKQIWSRNSDLSTDEQLQIMWDFLPEEKPKTISADLMERLVEAYTRPLLLYPPPLIEGARETLKRIKDEKYKLGLICNTGRTPGKTIRILLKQMGMIDYLDVTTFSDEFRIRKPNPRIFHHTLTQLKSLPRESLHVGDVVELDVLGAKNAGMQSVHLNPDHTPYEQIIPDFTIEHLYELKVILDKLK